MGRAPARLGTSVWKVTPDGEFSIYADGQGLQGASGNLMLPDGTLYQSSFTGGTVSRITPDGTVTAIADEGLSGPIGITIDELGNLYVADCRGDDIDRISHDGTLTPFAESSLFDCPNGITRDPAGYLYVLNFGDGKLLRVSPDGQLVEEFATFPRNRNGGHVLYGNGQLYVVARSTHQIFTVLLTGEVTLLAGSGERGNLDGPALESSFNLPNDLVLSPDGKRLYVNQAADNFGNQPSTIRVIYLE
jgi:sugar lactone lactonase YvrE